MSNLRAVLLGAGATSWYDPKDIDPPDQFYLTGTTAGTTPRRPARALEGRAPKLHGWETGL